MKGGDVYVPSTYVEGWPELVSGRGGKRINPRLKNLRRGRLGYEDLFSLSTLLIFAISESGDDRRPVDTGREDRTEPDEHRDDERLEMLDRQEDGDEKHHHQYEPLNELRAVDDVTRQHADAHREEEPANHLLDRHRTPPRNG